MNGARLVILLLAVCAAAVSQTNSRISRSGFMKAVEIGGIEPDEFANIIRVRGVDFRLSEDEKKKLAESGVPAKVLEAVAASHKPAEAPIQAPETPGTAAPKIDTPKQEAAPAAPAGPRIQPGRAVAVVVHKDNPVTNIDASALRRIYTGEMTAWKGGRNIYVINRETAGFARKVFYRRVLKADATRVFTLPGMSMMFRPQVVESGPGARGYVARIPDAIGYLDLSEVDDSVKVLSVNGVPPTEETIAGRSYLLIAEE